MDCKVVDAHRNTDAPEKFHRKVNPNLPEPGLVRHPATPFLLYKYPVYQTLFPTLPDAETGDNRKSIREFFPIIRGCSFLFSL